MVCFFKDTTNLRRITRRNAVYSKRYQLRLIIGQFNPHGTAEHITVIFRLFLSCISFMELMFVCLFVCFPAVTNPLWFYFHSPVAGFSLLVFEIS
jgi:hypothetical protein